MAPAQALDGDDKDGNRKNCNVVIKTEAMCTNNYEDDAFHAMPFGGDQMVRDCLDKGVDFVRTDEKDAAAESMQDDQGQCSEHSSSFGDSFSHSDGDLKSDQSGMEVDSSFGGALDGDPATLNGLPRLCRRKKVTAHWRKFISPLMWRCQWLELRMKELLSQASKYDRELALLKHQKDLQLEVIKMDDSLPETAELSCESHGKDSMKRRKRKRHEDIMDTTLYMKKHQIFSYYENKGADTDGHSVDDDNTDQVVENLKSGLDTDWLLGSKEGDSVFKQISVKELLLGIDALQSRVLGLRDRLSKARCKKEKEVPIVDLLRTKKDGNRNPVGAQQTSSDRTVDCVMEDANVRDSIQKSEGDATEPDINDITVELLFGTDNPFTRSQIGDLCKENSDDVLIDNQAAKEGYEQFKTVTHPAERPAVVVKEEAEIPSNGEIAGPLVAKHEPVLETEKVGMLREMVLEPCYTGKRRGRKPKKKRRGVPAAASKNQSEEALSTVASKKPKIEISTSKAASSNLKSEKVVLVAASSRRSQRVRKPKIY